MIGILISLGILLINLVYWLGLQGAESFLAQFNSNNLMAVKDVAVVSLCALFLVLAMFGRKAPAGEVTTEDDAVDNTDSKLEEEANALRTALQDSQQQLRSLQNQILERPKGGDSQVLHFLGLLQEKGRFLDFIMDDVTPYPDPQVGAVARVVHQGCRAVLNEYFEIKPANTAQEGERITLEHSFSPQQFRLLGSVKGEPPYNGVILHRGWKAEQVRLPKVSETDEGIITPTEVEVRS